MNKTHFFWIYLLCFISVLVSVPKAFSHGDEKNEEKTIKSQIVITKAYARETIPGTNLSSMYMSITNNSDKTLSLIGVSSDISDRIEIHQHTMNNGIMKMGKVDAIKVEAKTSVTLAPYGFHLMVFNLKAPLKAGKSATINLHFENEISQIVQVPVVSIKAQQH